MPQKQYRLVFNVTRETKMIIEQIVRQNDYESVTDYVRQSVYEKLEREGVNTVSIKRKVKAGVRPKLTRERLFEFILTHQLGKDWQPMTMRDIQEKFGQAIQDIFSTLEKMVELGVVVKDKKKIRMMKSVTNPSTKLYYLVPGFMDRIPKMQRTAKARPEHIIHILQRSKKKALALQEFVNELPDFAKSSIARLINKLVEAEVLDFKIGKYTFQQSDESETNIYSISDKYMKKYSKFRPVHPSDLKYMRYIHELGSVVYDRDYLRLKELDRLHRLQQFGFIELELIGNEYHVTYITHRAFVNEIHQIDFDRIKAKQRDVEAKGYKQINQTNERQKNPNNPTILSIENLK